MVTGACHCGNISFRIETAIPAADIIARACDCSFCRMHGATTWSDPAGQAEIHIRDPDKLQKYRFALHSADFLICAECGVYVGAVLTDGEQVWSTLNLRLSGEEPAVERASYGSENLENRIERRKMSWTPTRIL